MQDLGTCFGDRFQRMGDLKDLEAAQNHFQQAIELTPDGHPTLVFLIAELGIIHRNRYQRLGVVEDLEAAHDKFQTAVKLAPEGHPGLAGLMQDLGTCFGERFKRLGDIKDLDAAQNHVQQAITLTPDGHPTLVFLIAELGLAHRHRYQRLGVLEDLEAALANLQTAVELAPEGHPNLAQLMQDLGICFGERFQRMGDIKDLDATQNHFQRAITLTPDGHPNLAALMTQLGICQRDRFYRLSDLRDLEAAQKTFQKAIGCTPEGHPDLAQLIYNVGSCFGERYRRLGDLNDLESAQITFQNSVKLTPDGHPNLVQWMRTLGACYMDRYRRLGNLMDLESAEKKYQDALETTPEGHINLAGLHWELGACLAERYTRLKEPRDIEAARAKFLQSAKLYPDGHPGLISVMRDLGGCHVEQYKRLGDLQDLQAAQDSIQQAVKLVPEGSPVSGLMGPLAGCFRERYQRLRDVQDLEAMNSHYHASFNTSSSTPEECWMTALEWASFSAEFQPEYCVVAYSYAFKLLPELLWIGHSIPVRHDALNRLDIGKVTSNAVRVCADISRLTSAVTFMEQGVATIFQQTIQLKTDLDAPTPANEDVPLTLANELRQLSGHLYSGTCTDPFEVMKIVARRNELLAEIRQQLDLNHFLLPKQYTTLQGASQGGPVVILNSNAKGCDGILMVNPHSDPVHISLTDVTLELLETHQVVLRELLGRCDVRIRGESVSTRLFGQQELFTSKTTKECFSDMLTWLWVHVVSPIYNVLSSHGVHSGRLWWLPTGAFTGLPLHACSPTDEFIHSYTATLGALLDSYAKNPTDAPLKVGVVGVTHTASGSLNYLKGVGEEVEKILSIVDKPKVLLGQQATVDAVKQQLEECSWLHLACHGKQDLVQPTKSHLLLYGGTLDLETILRMPLENAEFVFLAACQTAMGDGVLVNESFHLGGGFIAAGFRGAIGTLWSMNDQDGPLVSEIVYSHLFRNGRQPRTSDAAEALHLAVKELKKRNVPYERWIPFIHMGV
ncbi:CHAT domain-containing protein [Mycena rosella]|uniref:CHAT domain-containing protein n=1 Tax=Mycena rosella TaxID=1033263 RepID=A0AAD7CSY7_MYCRO|nr:CHAT domain-containing protein [Mycena rosella]